MPSLKLGNVIPNFAADTTKGHIDFYDWQEDKWVLLFSHPADFTPVCTTELGKIALNASHFAKRNVKLLAHSCDTMKDHLVWINDIMAYTKDLQGEFPYPIIADESRELALKLDMIHEQDINVILPVTARAVYVIDPEHVLRLTMIYPTTTGRNIDEILRVIDSLQLVDKVPQIVTPVNWVVGDKVMILPTLNEEEINELFPSGVENLPLPSGISYIRNTSNYQI